ncbi:MAG: helix-turn-helix domain-containing protein [bacterium]|nr:helix-turn-helix domain-containing protein [bacterium]
MTIGKNIKSARIALGFKQYEFADSLGINKDYLGRIERDEQDPSRNVLIKLSSELGVSPNFIILGMEPVFLKDVENWEGLPDNAKEVFRLVFEMSEKNPEILEPLMVFIRDAVVNLGKVVEVKRDGA